MGVSCLHMAKYIVAIFFVVLLGAGGYYYFFSGTKDAAQTPANPAQNGQQAASSTYATSTFSVVYPNDFTLDEMYQYTQVNPKKPISGVRFTIPMSMATGTNLSSDTYISVEQLPRARTCTGDIYVADDIRAESETDGGVTYSLATTSGAGAGNFYEEMVWAITGSSPCTAVRYFIHSTNIGNYEPGAVREYDRTALLNAFDAIRRSVKLGTSATTTSF